MPMVGAKTDKKEEEHRKICVDTMYKKTMVNTKALKKNHAFRSNALHLGKQVARA